MHDDNMPGPPEYEDQQPEYQTFDLNDMLKGDGGMEHFMEHVRRAQLGAALNKRILDLINLSHAKLAAEDPESRDERKELLLSFLEEIAFAAAVSLNLQEDEPVRIIEMRMELRAAGVESWAALVADPENNQMKIDAVNTVIERTFQGV